MRRLLLALSLTALLFGIVTTSGQTAKPSVTATKTVNFGAVQAGSNYYAILSVTNNTDETISASAPVVTDPFFVDVWSCGTISSHTTCKTGTTDLRFMTYWALVSGTNRITQSVTLSYVGSTTQNSYPVTLTFVATQRAQK